MNMVQTGCTFTGETWSFRPDTVVYQWAAIWVAVSHSILVFLAIWAIMRKR